MSERFRLKLSYPSPVSPKGGEAVCLLGEKLVVQSYVLQLAEKLIIKTAVCLFAKKNDKHIVYRKQFKVKSVHFTFCH